MLNFTGMLAFLIGLIVLFIILKLISFPIKVIIKLLINALIGGIILYLINMFGAVIGLSITINWLSALIVGIAGVPGVIIVILLQMFIL